MILWLNWLDHRRYCISQDGNLSFDFSSDQSTDLYWDIYCTWLEINFYNSWRWPLRSQHSWWFTSSSHWKSSQVIVMSAISPPTPWGLASQTKLGRLGCLGCDGSGRLAMRTGMGVPCSLQQCTYMIICSFSKCLLSTISHTGAQHSRMCSTYMNSSNLQDHTASSLRTSCKV